MQRRTGNLTLNPKPVDSFQSRDGKDDDTEFQIPETVDFRVSNYGNVLLLAVHSLWENDIYCDVIFQVHDKEFRCHRIILAAISTYFRQVFCKTKSQKIRIRNIKEEVIGEILRYAYTGTIKLTYSNVFEILLACHHFEIPSLIEIGEQYAVCLIEASNCFEVMTFARELSMSALYDKAWTFMEQGQDELFNGSDVYENNLESVMEFFEDRSRHMNRKGLPVVSERREMYFIQFILKFISKHQNMDEDVVEMIKRVNLPILPTRHWSSIINAHGKLLGNALVQYLLEMSELCRDGIRHDDMPSSWNAVPDRNWKIAVEKPTAHPERAKSLCPEKDKFNDSMVIEPDVAVRTIELYFRPWMHNVATVTNVLGGIKMTYNDGKERQYGLCRPNSTSPPKRSFTKHVVTLEDGELIVGVDVAFGWVINRLTFHTNKGRQLGPFGGQGGDVIKYRTPNIGPYDHLHCFSGREVMTYEEVAITHLGIVWACFDAGSTSHSEHHVEGKQCV